MKENLKKTVLVGMSGGVDSSVAAYILKEQGYHVIGVTMLFWQQEDSGITEEQADLMMPAAASDARGVCEHLDIPHTVLDFRKDFQCHVIDNFVQEYVAGRTPNPCIRCNRYVKWQSLLTHAKEIGADYVATGHYAKIVKMDSGRFAVQCADADQKDQTYALYNLTQEQLSCTLFPLGAYEKEEVRRIAEAAELPVAHKKDSQEICFIPDDDYGRFIRESGAQVPPQGEFVTLDGNVLGIHKGIHQYTIGQRKGLGISAEHPLYVCDLDTVNNRVVLGSNENVFSDVLYCREINYMGAEAFRNGQKVMAKIRYRAKEAPCTLTVLSDGFLRCDFDEPVRAITPGQAVVFYEGDVVLGGGVIIKA